MIPVRLAPAAVVDCGPLNPLAPSRPGWRHTGGRFGPRQKVTVSKAAKMVSMCELKLKAPLCDKAAEKTGLIGR
jgi:hypothetical protein